MNTAAFHLCEQREHAELPALLFQGRTVVRLLCHTAAEFILWLMSKQMHVPPAGNASTSVCCVFACGLNTDMTDAIVSMSSVERTIALLRIKRRVPG